MRIINLPIDKIEVRGRYRKNLGDIDSLAANISEMGLLQPIGVDESNILVYGRRRLLACEQLEGKKIPCVVVNLQSVLAGESAENEFRKQFTPTERAAIGKAIEKNGEADRPKKTWRIRHI